MSKASVAGRAARQPLREGVAEKLSKAIRTGQSPGDRLPSEVALSKRFGVSVLTLRDALARLASDGLIERRHGSGTYVADLSARRHVAILMAFELGAHVESATFFLWRPDKGDDADAGNRRTRDEDNADDSG